ncbi:hypothetical protein MMC16_005710 [Acarospora aff. strigata]|nr:hypothetical protein [Acarospora aff. strigata]
MVRRKEMSNGTVAVGSAPAPLPASKLPAALRFPLLVTLSLSLSSLLYSFSSDYTAGDLATVSRSLNKWSEVAELIGWRTVELGIGWWGEYDSYDLASLTLLSHLPTLYLLRTFYSIHPTTVLTSLAIDLLTTYIPFRLLRPVSPTHSLHAPKGSVANRAIINDIPLRALTTILAAGIYGVVIFGSYSTWLPVHLAVHFEGLRDISAAHTSALPFLIATFIPVGYAAREFLFSPATGALLNLGDITARAFNPATATLGETIKYNVWGYSKRTRELIKRTATLVAVSGFNTWLQAYVTIEGAENYGAAGWAAVWATAAALTGLMYSWVGDVEGVNN